LFWHICSYKESTFELTAPSVDYQLAANGSIGEPFAAIVTQRGLGIALGQQVIERGARAVLRLDDKPTAATARPTFAPAPRPTTSKRAGGHPSMIAKRNVAKNERLENNTQLRLERRQDPLNRSEPR
jgi:hypothetical protein